MVIKIKIIIVWQLMSVINFKQVQILFDAFELIFANRKNILIINAMQNTDLVADQVFNALTCLK